MSILIVCQYITTTLLTQYFISPNDIFVVFSHRGTKTFSLQALEIAKKLGTTTILVTGIGSPDNPTADIRMETCAQENCGARLLYR